MSNEIFGFMGSFGGIGNIVNYIVWFFIFILVAGSLTAIVIMLLVKKQSKKVVEINMMNRRVRTFTGRLKKPKGKAVKLFWASKIKRNLPDFQQKSIFVKGSQDLVFLLKDNNGMYHTARIPSYHELKKWYKVVHGKDLDDKKQCSNIYEQQLNNIFILPAPHEDLDWLAGQCVEADKEFKVEHWWQSPVVAYIGVGFICFLMWVVTMILERKL